MVINVPKFWDNKILQWEESRYSSALIPGQLRIGNAGGRFLVGRFQMTLDLLKPHLRGASILELGCGSGILAMHLIHAGAGFVHGIDISDRAIEKAKERSKELGFEQKTSFEVKDLGDLHAIQEDIVIALGLTDWLSPENIVRLFTLIGKKPFVVSFSENKPSFSRRLHRLYVFLHYGWRSKGYVPQYHNEGEIRGLVPDDTSGRLRMVRDRRLGFGLLLTNVPD